jgi:Ca-activated chloride channel family protein
VKVALPLAALLFTTAVASAQSVLPPVPQIPAGTLVQATQPAQPPPAASQSTNLSQQPPVFRSGSELVALNVAVQDGNGYVRGLKPSDFAVYEDGVKQDVRFFESTSVPIDLVVLLDTSASMGDKMALVHGAAAGFLHTLRSGDRGAVVAFSDNVEVLQPLTADQGRLDAAVQSTHSHGGTALYNAVYIALKQFGRASHHEDDVRRQAIVVLSDGADTTSLVNFDDVLALAHQMGVNIYTVALQSEYALQQLVQQGGRRYFSEADYAMKTLARDTGAESFFPASTELKGIYASIATDLASEYSLGYVPGNRRNDGRFRRIVVQVVTRPDLHPRTRQGYTLATAATGTRSPY